MGLPSVKALLDGFEKLINERASAAVLRDHLALLRDRLKFASEENEELSKENAKLKDLCDTLTKEIKAKAPKGEIIRGELTELGILWTYEANAQTQEWVRLTPFCPHCRIEIAPEFERDFYAIDRVIGTTDYICDNPRCGKLKVRLHDTPEAVEDRIKRIINATQNRSNPSATPHS